MHSYMHILTREMKDNKHSTLEARVLPNHRMDSCGIWKLASYFNLPIPQVHMSGYPEGIQLSLYHTECCDVICLQSLKLVGDCL